MRQAQHALDVKEANKGVREKGGRRRQMMDVGMFQSCMDASKFGTEDGVGFSFTAWCNKVCTCFRSIIKRGAK